MSYYLPYYFIENNKIVNDILYNLFSGEISSRNTIKTFTSSCKYTQLRYIILCIYEQIFDKNIVDIFNNRFDNYKEYGNMLHNISSLITKLLSNKNTIFYNLIFLNTIVNENLIIPFEDTKFISPFEDNIFIIKIENYEQLNDYLVQLKLQPTPFINICFCIFHYSETNYYISHYFTFIILKNDVDNSYHYYINSSYGSDNICVPQYTTELSITDLILFFYVFNNIENNYESFYELFTIYFGKGGIEMPYSEEDIDENPKLKFSSILPNIGLDAEIKIINVNSKIGIIHNYQNNIYNNIVIPLIQEKMQPTKSRKTRKYKSIKIIGKSGKANKKHKSRNNK